MNYSIIYDAYYDNFDNLLGDSKFQCSKSEEFIELFDSMYIHPKFIYFYIYDIKDNFEIEKICKHLVNNKLSYNTKLFVIDGESSTNTYEILSNYLMEQYSGSCRALTPK